MLIYFLVHTIWCHSIINSTDWKYTVHAPFVGGESALCHFSLGRRLRSTQQSWKRGSFQSFLVGRNAMKYTSPHLSCVKFRQMIGLGGHCTSWWLKYLISVCKIATFYNAVYMYFDWKWPHLAADLALSRTTRETWCRPNFPDLCYSLLFFEVLSSFEWPQVA